MRILIAEDDLISKRLLEATLRRSGYDVLATSNGAEALAALTAPDAPRLAVIDWMMPEVDGVEVCRRLRASADTPYVYLILLTAKSRKEDAVEGLEAGADDFLAKPFDPQELRARIRVGERIVALESTLAGKVRELEAAMREVKTLQGLLPICMYCKKIRDDQDTWQRLETYIQERSGAVFSHSLCEECLEKHYPKQAAKVASGGARRKD